MSSICACAAMKRGAAMKKKNSPHAGHFDPPYALDVSRPSVPLPPRSGTLQLRENRSVPLKCPARGGGKPSNWGANQPQTLLFQLKRPQTPPFSAKICSGAGRIHRAGHFDFPIHAKCPAEVSRCSPATLEAGVDTPRIIHRPPRQREPRSRLNHRAGEPPAAETGLNGQAV